MKLFKKNLRNSQQNSSTIRGRLSEIIDRKKRLLADFLGKQSEKLSPGGKKVMLLFFGVMMGGICLTLILKPFHHSATSSSFIIKALAPAVIAPQNTLDSLLSQQERERLIGFMQDMDSLRKYDRAGYDEFLNGREGLLDSVKALINIY